MKLELFDVDEFIEINNLKEVTSPVLFERGNVPNPEGLISNEIFGVSTKSRKETFAYINLHGEFFHPHIYKIIKRVFRNIDKIVNGEKRYIIKGGELIPDDNGETGIEFLYENWEKIKWKGNGGMSSERNDLIGKTPKKEVFINKMIVIPAFYRDINSSSDGGGAVPPIDNLYAKLIRNCNLLSDRDMFDFSFHNTNFTIQNTLVEIYDDFKSKLEKKKGIIRKYLLGKNVDYCVRTVISGPVYNVDDPRDNIVDFEHSAVPIYEAVVMCYPFVIAWLTEFFRRELIEGQYMKFLVNDEDNNVSVKNPEGFYTDKYIKKHVDSFVHDTSSRFDPIEVPLSDGRIGYLRFTGYLANVSAEQSLVERNLTWTDLLFMATSEITKDKHVMVTRYPILDAFGIFISKIHISSTLKTVPMKINDTLYKWYPYIDPTLTKEQVSNNFIDTMRFSNAYLKGLDGDYDGDQITAKILWTQEANLECEKMIKSKQFVLNTTGNSMRTIDLEAIQTFYVLTKDPI